MPNTEILQSESQSQEPKIILADPQINLAPQIKIDNPKRQIQRHRENKIVDLSDHYPIFLQLLNLNIASYNIQCMHTKISNIEGKENSSAIEAATEEFANYFQRKNADIYCVQELYDYNAVRSLREKMALRGYISTFLVGENLDSFFYFLHGGVCFFIKQSYADTLVLDKNRHSKKTEHFPSQVLIYQNKIDYFIGADALVNKGVIHLQIPKNDEKIHIFGTHLQAYYADRDHYSEITLAQCVELRRFIENQKKLGYIKSGERIIITGDFNIPNPGQTPETMLLFKKMRKILGPDFTFYDYAEDAEKKFTRDIHNSYNVNEIGTDINVNLDLFIECNNSKDQKLDLGAQDAAVFQKRKIEEMLSLHYGELQLDMASFVRKKATIFTLWRLAALHSDTLKRFNQRFEQLMRFEEQLIANKINPLENPIWKRKYEHLKNDICKAAIPDYILFFKAFREQFCRQLAQSIHFFKALYGYLAVGFAFTLFFCLHLNGKKKAEKPIPATPPKEPRPTFFKQAEACGAEAKNYPGNGCHADTKQVFREEENLISCPV